MRMLFEWDAGKARQNLRKHRVNFDEAPTVVSDDYAITIADVAHSHREDRLIIIGTSHKNRLLVVAYTERGKKIRLISASHSAGASTL